MLCATGAIAQSVEGTVVNVVTGNGIAGVKVQLAAAGAGSGGASYTAATDEQGRFHLDSVKEGLYRASYSAPHYLDEARTLSHSPAGSASFQVSGAGVVKLEARMVPLSKVSGKVVDPWGNPVPDARVELMTAPLLMGAKSDAEGRFEIPIWLGTFALAVAPPMGFKAPPPDPESGRPLGWVYSYYPGSPRADGASKLVLRPGGEIAGLEVKLLAVEAHAVRGVLLGLDGKPAAKLTVSLQADYLASLRAETNSDGAFEFPAVVDGEWLAAAETQSDGMTLRASQIVDVAGHALDGVKLRLSEPFSVRGKVVVEVPDDLPMPKSLGPALSITGHDGHSYEQTLAVRAYADSSFSVEQVYEGTYQIHAGEPPPGYYLDAIRLGNADIDPSKVSLSSGAAAIEIVYKTNGGTVRGAVENCAAGDVVLMPQERDRWWKPFIRTVRCDSKDRYEAAGVRPGEYYALAFAADGYSPLDERKFDDFLQSATRVTVQAGAASSADLRAISQK
jgi:5-hydroxyisourate hydrolase-like protein (transthyretin family)